VPCDELRVDRRVPAAPIRPIHDVVVDQRERVQELQSGARIHDFV